MKRREILKGSLLGAAGLIGRGSPFIASHSTPKETRPNILWIIAEDLSPDLGCYGDTIVHTPNLDRLAAQGVRFTNAFTTSPICSPSRSAFMTGLYQTSIGAHHHRSHRDDGYRLPSPVRVITGYFREAGYFTCNCSGDRWETPGKTDFNFDVPVPPFEGTDWRQRKPGQPFFAQVNLIQTHRTMVSFPHLFEKTPDRAIDPSKISLPPYYPDHPVVRRDWADYLECIQVLDKKVGQILERLREDGLEENTIVFFFGDNGRPHVRGKGFLYEGGIRVPLIVRWPGQIAENSVEEGLVSAIDFAPTCLSLAGIPIPDHLQGRVFLGPEKEERPYIVAARDRADETVDRIRCIRTNRYKYIRNFYPHIPYTQSNVYRISMHPTLTVMTVLYAEGELTPEQARFMRPHRPYEELYDLESDPHEIRNLAGSPEHRPVLRELASTLDEWIQATGDQGEIPEDPRQAAEVYLKVLEPDYRKRMERRGLSPDISPKEYLAYWERALCPEEFGSTKR